MRCHYREEMNMGYWEGFIKYMEQHYPDYRFGNPSRDHTRLCRLRCDPEFRLRPGMNTKGEESIRVDVTLTNTPKEWFTQLQAKRKTIEAEIGINDGRWEWDERPGKAEFHIILRKFCPT